MAEFVKASMKGWPGYLTLPISRRPLDGSNWSAGLIFPVQGASVGSRHTRSESGPKWRGLRVGVDAPGRAAAQHRFAGRQWRRVRAGSGGVDGAEDSMGRGKDGLVRTAGRHGEFDPADADADGGADLDQLAANSAAGGVSEIGGLQGQTAQAVDENVRH